MSGGDVAHPLEIPSAGGDVDVIERGEFDFVHEAVSVRGLDVEAVSEVGDVVVYERGLALGDVELEAEVEAVERGAELDCWSGR